MIRIITALALCLSATVTDAAPKTYALPEDTAQLRPAEGGTQAGLEAAQGHCLSCHSPDYIAMQPPKKGQAFWTAEVGKMVKTYGAPIPEEDAKSIAAYLAATY